jgi:hypothetical protein
MAHRFQRPCLICGQLTLNRSRCDTHEAEFQAKRDKAREPKRQHYKGNYQARAKKVRESATMCYLCGQGYKPNDPFQADHVIAGNPNSPLLPAHRSCNMYAVICWVRMTCGCVFNVCVVKSLSCECTHVRCDYFKIRRALFSTDICYKITIINAV